ncbi:MAG TPA: ABC transporter substrate-binding protein, partial [Sulfolobales archaeon]|nr:ABC transporter substrate-binding protein [Sulfolobales archaeon]
MSRIIAVFSVIVIVVAIAAFFGGMYAGRPGAQAPAIQTVTVGGTVTVTRIVTQTVIATPTSTPTPPMTLPSKIVIGLSIPLSGAQADAGKRTFWGVMAAVKWVNEVYGGVNLYGRKIPLEVKYYDDESKKENVISYTERL